MTSTTSAHDDHAARGDATAVYVSRRVGLKDWISVLELTMKMVRSVPQTGRVTPKDVQNVRAAATGF